MDRWHFWGRGWVGIWLIDLHPEGRCLPLKKVDKAQFVDKTIEKFERNKKSWKSSSYICSCVFFVLVSICRRLHHWQVSGTTHYALLKNPFRVQACNRWPGGLRSPLLDHLVTQHDLRVRANTFVEGLELSDDQQRITGLRCRSRGQTTEFLEESWLWKFYI